MRLSNSESQNCACAVVERSKEISRKDHFSLNFAAQPITYPLLLSVCVGVIVVIVGDLNSESLSPAALLVGTFPTGAEVNLLVFANKEAKLWKIGAWSFQDRVADKLERKRGNFCSIHLALLLNVSTAHYHVCIPHTTL